MYRSNRKQLLMTVLIIAFTFTALTIFSQEKSKSVVIEKPAASTASIKMPPDLSIPDAVSYIKVKNLASFLETMDYWAAAVRPELPKGTAKMTIGQQFGDPTMQTIDSSRPTGIVILDPKKFTNPFVMYLPVKETEKIAKSIQERGSFTIASPADKMLVVADDQTAVKRGFDAWPAIKGILMKPPVTDIVAYVNVEQLMSIYGEEIRQKIKELQSQMQMMQQGTSQAQQQEMEAQIQEMLNLIEQISSCALEIQARNSGLQAGILAKAKSGTELFGLFSPGTTPEHSLYKYIPEGAISGSFAGDSEAITEFSGRLSNRMLQKAGKFTEEQLASIAKLQELQKAAFGNQFAFSGFLPGSANLNGLMVYKIKDQKKAVEMLKESVKQIEMFSDPQTGVTMTGELKENFRKAGEVDIHKMTIKFNFQDPMQAQGMMMFFPQGQIELEIGFFEDNMIYTMATPIEDIISNLKTKKAVNSMNSMNKFPSGGQFYMDVDVPKTIKGFMQPIFGMMMAMMGDQNPMKAFDQITAPPLTIYADSAGGTMKAEMDFPLEIILELKKAFEQMQKTMQPPSQQQPAPMQ